MCYTIAIHQEIEGIDLISIGIKFNNEAIKDLHNNYGFQCYLSEESDHIGMVYGEWEGAKPLSFHASLGNYVTLNIEKAIWQQNSNDPCTNYPVGESLFTCRSKEMIPNDNSTKCNNSCAVVNARNYYKAAGKTIVDQCNTVDDHFCQLEELMIAFDISKGKCQLPCSVSEFSGNVQENRVPEGNHLLYFILGYRSNRVSIFEEYLLYDFPAIVGSVGGSLGLFIGFSFFDFGSLILDTIIRHYVRT
jgi:hypothetical protein